MSHLGCIGVIKVTGSFSGTGFVYHTMNLFKGNSVYRENIVSDLHSPQEVESGIRKKFRLFSKMIRNLFPDGAATSVCEKQMDFLFRVQHNAAKEYIAKKSYT